MKNEVLQRRIQIPVNYLRTIFPKKPSSQMFLKASEYVYVLCTAATHEKCTAKNLNESPRLKCLTKQKQSPKGVVKKGVI